MFIQADVGAAFGLKKVDGGNCRAARRKHRIQTMATFSSMPAGSLQ
jgi:hypothetical protein